MNIEQLKNAIKLSYKTKTFLIAAGAPGIGKTAGYRQASVEMSEEYGEEFGTIELYGSTINPAELADIKYIKDGEVADASQSWLPTNEKVEAGLFPARGIISLEEIGGALPSVQQGMQRLGLERQLGSLTLADGWHCVATTNRASDKAASGKLSNALINRAMYITVEPDPDEFFNHGLSQNFDSSILSFVRFRPDCLTDFDPTKKTENPQFCSPRSLNRLSDVLKVVKDRTHSSMLELYSSIVGDGRGTEIYSFLKIEKELPDMDKLIESPGDYPVPDDLSVQYATIGALRNRLTAENAEGILSFITRMPVEMTMTAIKDLAKTEPTAIFKSKLYKKWAKENNKYAL